MEVNSAIEDKLAGGSTQWIDESMDSPVMTSTQLPTDNLLDDSGTIWGLVLVVFGALTIIVVMFLIAVFIDCRQQKIVEMQHAHHHACKSKRKSRMKIPQLGRTIPEDDREQFAGQMQTPMSEPPV